MLGVRTENVGEKSVSIKPYIKGRNSAKGTVSTIGGNVRVEWKKSRGVFEISVESENEGVKKHIYLPNGDIKVTKKKAVTYKCRI